MLQSRIITEHFVKGGEKNYTDFKIVKNFMSMVSCIADPY